MREVSFVSKMRLASEKNNKYNLIERLVKAQRSKMRQALWKSILNQLNLQKKEDDQNKNLKQAFDKSINKVNDTLR